MYDKVKDKFEERWKEKNNLIETSGKEGSMKKAGEKIEERCNGGKI